MWASAAPGAIKGKEMTSLVRQRGKENRRVAPNSTAPAVSVEDMVAFAEREDELERQRQPAPRQPLAGLVALADRSDGADPGERMWSLPSAAAGASGAPARGGRVSGGVGTHDAPVRAPSGPAGPSRPPAWSAAGGMFQPSVGGVGRGAPSGAAGPSLLDGDFDEEESKMSFQQALLEWRRGGGAGGADAGGGDARGGDAGSPGGCGAQNRVAFGDAGEVVEEERAPVAPGRPAAPTPASGLAGVGTDADPQSTYRPLARAPRPSSARGPMTLFDKLEARELARAAGAAASGASGPQAARHAAPAPPAAPAGPVAPSRVEYPDEGEGPEAWEGEGVAAGARGDSEEEIEYDFGDDEFA